MGSQWQELRKMVKEMLDESDKGFTDWEVRFLDDMYRRADFSENMEAKIVELYQSKM